MLVGGNNIFIITSVMDILMNLEPEEVFKQVSDEILNNLYDSKSVPITHIDNTMLQQAKNEFKKILILHNFNINEIKEHLQNRESSQPQRTQWFNSILEEKSTDLLYQTLLHNNSRYGDTITNFDWYLKIILGTSELKTINYSLLQLTLSTVNCNNKPKEKLFDINRDVLKKFINVLQCADVDVNT